MKPSAKLILAALRRGEVLTPLVSLHRYGVHALSQRITELRLELLVEDIVSEQVVGDKFHRYYMPKFARNVSTPTTPKATPVRAHVRVVGKLIDEEQMVLFT